MKNLNIVMIVVDAFKPKHLSMFGYEKETDKNLKIIAKESILFRNQFSVSNATAPALTSIFSGLYPSNHGVIHQMPYTKQEEIEKVEKIKFWLPSYLKENGYETIALDWVGLWFKKGFDYYKESEKELDKLFPATSESMELAMQKINQAKKPFFIFIHLWDTHFPFPNTEYEVREKADVNEIIDKIKNEKQKEYVRKRIEAIKLEAVKDIINKYDKTIKIIDSEIGKLYNFLKEKELWDETIFLVLGDHGDIINENGIYFSHCSLFDASIHAPFIMHLPEIKAAEINELVQNVDIVPTILDFLEEKVEDLDGVSLLPLIKEGKKVRDKLFLFDGLAEDVRAIRTENKKLIIAKNNFCNLCKADHHYNLEEYDLANDSKEEKNVFSGKSELLKFLS